MTDGLVGTAPDDADGVWVTELWTGRSAHGGKGLPGGTPERD